MTEAPSTTAAGTLSACSQDERHINSVTCRVDAAFMASKLGGFRRHCLAEQVAMEVTPSFDDVDDNSKETKYGK